ncbi:hypothetical protein SAMN04488589_1729 [Methanolobus vulcani]|uniref:Uncharacterized protein n=1 Tax=Methanolobus vulcani TaxID=38026 RepID=A0A7Z7AX04_9EURY|nr:hypothetical protein [Methanolobus vulcani]SDF93378.1 hypothetical protein SAMN04488589_1729 [Methanolobus vulcani]
MSQKKNKHFKHPHTIRNEWDNLWVELELKAPENFKSTAAAMDEVAKAQDADGLRKKRGTNNYSNFTLNLMNALDTFTTECPTTINGAGKEENYEFSNPSDFTVFLIWIMRNQQSHNGGVVNEMTKSRYENTIKRFGTKPIIDLPEEIEIGTKFEIQYDDYILLKKCVFDFIGEKIPNEDLKILKLRSSITNISIHKPQIVIEMPEGVILVDLDVARKYFKSSSSGEIIVPENAVYDPNSKKIILSNGESFSAEFRSHFV